MMVSSEEFYELPQEKQRKLVDERRVILDQKPVRKIPEYGAPIRVLDEPPTTTIFDRLHNSRYTVSELAEEIGVQDRHVRNVINKHRHQRFEKLLDEYNAVLRAKDVRGPALVYSLESIPYFARVMDPTLGCSLLRWDDEIVERFGATQWIPAGKVTQVDENYAWVIANYWELSPDDTFDYLTEFDRRYAETALGPLPIVDEDDQYENVRNRLSEAESAYSRRKAIDENTAREKVDAFAGDNVNVERSIGFYQSLSVTLFDLLEYARNEDPSILGAIEEQLDVVFEWIVPEPDKESATLSQPELDTTDGANLKESESEPTTSSPDEEFDWDERDLLIELVVLTQELGRPPSETDLNDRTPFSHRAYVEKFGSLVNALKRAGILTENESNPKERSNHYENGGLQKGKGPN